MKDNAWIQTFTGIQFYFLNVQPEQICIEDIAHALSNICRFTGHCNEFYSVAEHSVLVSEYVNHNYTVAGLLHDAAEAYIGDMARPLKKIMSQFRETEKRIYKVIAEKFGIPEVISAEVKEADTIMLATEKDNLMSPEPSPWEALNGIRSIISTPKLIPFTPRQIEVIFLEKYKELVE